VEFVACDGLARELDAVGLVMLAAEPEDMAVADAAVGTVPPSG
jgi:hypothetical protein